MNEHSQSCLERPVWLRARVRATPRVAATRERLRAHGVGTVCEAAACPNLSSCWAEGHATFLILGGVCTRGCRFCNIEAGTPQPPDPTEPARVAGAVASAGVCHAVVTSVTRDDLPDGGASHWAAVLRAIRSAAPGVSLEALVPDFAGRENDLAMVLDARPDVFGHNLETVPRLYAGVRRGADYQRSLGVLRLAAEAGLLVKTSLLLGLGETGDELEQVFYDARGAGCRILFLGQYLPPTPRHAALARHVPPEEFAALRDKALALGFDAVESAPLVRSSLASAAQARLLATRVKLGR